jgi:hypothetical protein
MEAASVANRFAAVPGETISAFVYVWRGKRCSQQVFGQASLRAYQLACLLKK